MLREEVRATVDDFREKGAIGTLKDVALDTRDMATSVGGGLIHGVKGLVVDDDRRYVSPVLQVQEMPVRGTVAPLRFEDGTTVQATVVEFDADAHPPRAKVAAPGLGELLVVELLHCGREPTPLQEPHEQDAQTGEASLLDLFVEECRDTVKELREKGAVSAVRDAAHDAVEIIGSTASKAVSGARSLASPSVVTTDVGASETPSSEATSSSSTAPAPSTTASMGSVNLLDLPLFDTIKQEWSNTVQDVREKGPMVAVKDAALDAAEIVGGMAKSAVSGAKSIVAGTSGNQQNTAGSGPSVFSENDQASHEGSAEDQHSSVVKKLVEDYEQSLRGQEESPRAKRLSKTSETLDSEAEEFID